MMDLKSEEIARSSYGNSRISHDKELNKAIGTLWKQTYGNHD